MGLGGDAPKRQPEGGRRPDRVACLSPVGVWAETSESARADGLSRPSSSPSPPPSSPSPRPPPRPPRRAQRLLPLWTPTHSSPPSIRHRSPPVSSSGPLPISRRFPTPSVWRPTLYISPSRLSPHLQALLHICTTTCFHPGATRYHDLPLPIPHPVRRRRCRQGP